MSLAHLLLKQARLQPDRSAVFHGALPWASYRDWAARSAGAAQRLRTAGLATGDRVVLFMRNHPRYLELLWAAWWAGLVVVPVNAKLHPREVEWIVDNAQARWAFVTLLDRPRPRARSPQVENRADVADQVKRPVEKIMLLGAGELGKEVVIAAKRLGKTVVAVDRYAGAPAMQVADAFEVVNMLDAGELAIAVHRHHPDMIVPEIEVIRTEKLRDFEREGITVIPTAEAMFLTMNRVAIREVAARNSACAPRATPTPPRSTNCARALSAPASLAW